MNGGPWRKYRHMPLTPEAVRVKVAAMSEQEGECLVWKGNVGLRGYGRINIGGHILLVHRLVRSLADGTAYRGLHVHHKCHNKLCVRLEHLEVLSLKAHAHEHSKPQETCKRGHTMRDAYIRPDTGMRMCRECVRLRSERQLQLRRARRLPPAVRTCIQCLKPFGPRRNSFARYCGQPCRMAAFKARHPEYRAAT